jgi:hypothetical protein
MIKLLKPDGAEILIEFPGSPPLKLLYEWLNCGTIEVPGGGFNVNGEIQQFVLDEDGKLRGKPINVMASELYDDALYADPRGLRVGRDVLVGNVIILTEPNLLS